MRTRRILGLALVSAAICLMPTALFAQCPDTDSDGQPGSINGNLRVNEVAALEGNCGLEVVLAGSTAFVQDNSPDRETVYRASFLLEPANLNMPSPSVQTLFEGFGFVGPNFGVAFRLQLFKNNQGAHRLFALVFTNRRVKRGTPTLRIGLPGVPPDAGRVCLEWSAGATNTGFVRYTYVGLTEACPSDPSAYLEKLTTNQFWEVTGVRLGAARPPAAAATGSMYLDSFESFRTLAP